MCSAFRFSALLCLISFASLAQDEMLRSAFDDFSANRVLQYEEIPVAWNMAGTIQADLNEGLNNLIENNPGLAETSFTKVIKKDTTLWQAYYFRAASRKQLRKFDEAAQDVNWVLKGKPNFYEGYIELAKIYYCQQKLSETDDALNKAIELNDRKAIAHFLKGDLYIGMNQVQPAKVFYKNCLRADSLFHDARIKLAIIELTTNQDFAGAMNELDKVLTYDSLYKSALLFRSIIEFEKNREQSIRDLSKLISISPNNMMARYIRGVAFTDLRKFDEAFSDFQFVIRNNSTSENNFSGQQTWTDKKIDLQNVGAYTLTRVYGLPEEDGEKLKQAYCHIITRNYDKAIARIDETTNPEKEPLALYLKAVANEHKGEHTKAYKLYRDALKLDGSIADALKKRAIYEQELELWEESVEDLTAVLKLTPDAFVIYKIRGVSYFYCKKFKEAISDFNEYLKYDSGNKEVIKFRGVAYRENNQRLRAYIDFAVCGSYDGYDFEDMYALVKTVLEKGDTTYALYILNLFTSTAPRFSKGYALKFKIYQARNQWTLIYNEIENTVYYIRPYTEIPDKVYLLTLLGAKHHAGGQHILALKSFEDAILLSKKSAFTYLERSKLYKTMGKSQEAEEDLKKAASLGSKEAKQLLTLAK